MKTRNILTALLLMAGLQTARAQRMLIYKADKTTLELGVIEVDSIVFVDEEPVPGICPDNHHPHAIDLGLPSGTKWACCNVGATSPEGYGNYYAWGETKKKSYYFDDNYAYYDFYEDDFTFIGYDIAGTGYDAATVNMGASWRMPSSAQIQELIDKCSYQWTQQNGVNGILVTGGNGGQVFLPAAGERDYETNGAGSFGNYWASSLSMYDDDYDISSAGCMGFSTDWWEWDDGAVRFQGFTVRAVCVQDTPNPTLVTGITLSETSLSLTTGGTQALTATVQPVDASNKSVTWESSNEAVATVNGEGLVTAVAEGTCTITCSATDASGVKAECEVTVKAGEPGYLTCPDDHHPHAIDLGLPSGTKWACCNVGASTPEGYGGYYAWGETSEKSSYSYSNYVHLDNYFGNFKSIGSDIAGTEYDAATVNMGASWCMPSHEQQEELMDNCSYQWTQQNDMEGILVAGSNGGQIFLPAAGMRDGSELSYAGTYGYYWSSSVDTDYNYSKGHYAYYLYFNLSLWDWTRNLRSDGRSVRPVRKQ